MHRFPRPRRALLLLVVLILGSTSGAVRGESAAPTPVDGINAAYRAGRLVEGNATRSTAVDYDGEWLSLQATSVGRRALEPTIGVDRRGNAFYAASWHGDSKSIVLPVTEVRRSTDGGATWENVSPLLPVTDDPNPPVNADPYVFVDQGTDRVFNPEAAGACLYMNVSDDAGETWLTNPVVCGGVNVDHQSFEAGPFPPAFADLQGDYPNVLWYCSNHVADSQCSHSLDGGITWGPSATPAYLGYDPSAGGLCGGLAGHVEIDSEGRAFLPKGHCRAPYISVSDDLGTTWRRVRVSTLSAASTHIAAALDDADNLYVVFWDGELRLPWLVVSTDHGQTFSEPLMVAPPDVREVNFPEITAGEAGKIALTFPGTASDKRNDRKRPWNDYVVVTTNALDPDPLFVSTTANAPENPVHRGNCGPGRCGPMWDFIDIVVSPVDGGVWATLSDTCESEACRAPGGAIDAESSGIGTAVRQLGGPRIRTPQPPEA
jgi:hypothetical protein